jgi:hypothetical protein
MRTWRGRSSTGAGSPIADSDDLVWHKGCAFIGGHAPSSTGWGFDDGRDNDLVVHTKAMHPPQRGIAPPPHQGLRGRTPWLECRLDQGTSGVIVFARNDAVLRNLHAQFRDKAADGGARKRYVAVVAGRMTPSEGEVRLPIRKDLDDPPKQVRGWWIGMMKPLFWRVVVGVCPYPSILSRLPSVALVGCYGPEGVVGCGE